MRIILVALFALIPVLGQAQGPVDSSGRPFVNATDGTGPFTVDGTLTCNAGTGTLAVSGPLTDTQLRATPVPVSGTVTANAGSGTLAISAAALPLPSGAATSANQDGIVRDGTGDTTQANVSTGRLHVDGSGVTQPISGTVTVGTFPDNEPVNVAQMNGVAVTMGNGASGTGVQRVTVADDSTGEIRVADSAGNQVESATASPSASARGWVVRQVGPCSNDLEVFFPVDIVTATTVLVATGVGGQHVYICGLNLVTAGANNVAVVAGTGATCGTSTAGMNGGVTAAEGYNFAANGGIALPNTGRAHMRTESTGDSVCIITSAAVQLSGTIAYVIE